ncbi:MAG: hypothetical protein J0I04_00655 [Paenarthrobacter ureafaciens]|uniref:hypothetical protein n=1 Tax=Paenarthrobacter ureafaciens TaxID=37931 RepID=UPI001AD321D0|nr:hypothetical protein [Paenarthrobacter ureafaciens]MBN9128151.1 hypothetical protein [Paenarthrobacter ureafaciens]
MKPLFLVALASPTFEELDVHVLLMTGLVLVTGLGAAVCIMLLLLLAPVLHLLLATRTTKKSSARKSAPND